MAYPKKNSFIDMRSKIKPAISKTKSILLELDKLVADSNVIPRRRHSLFANRIAISTPTRNRNLLNRSSLASPSTSFTPYRRQTIQPMWTKIHETPKLATESSKSLNSGNSPNESFTSSRGLNTPSTDDFINFESQPTHSFGLLNGSSVDFSFVEPPTNGFVKELENVQPFVFDKPLMPGFIENELQNGFEFALPENRGPRLSGNKFDNLPNDKDSELILNELHPDSPILLIEE
ncbi:hypothetical protein M3Y97_00019200 [Aphelenchoides bicaudatus]|nr:hypothetical protein M3Y97_00019200 [Aphelenchoides bicaudatus]